MFRIFKQLRIKTISDWIGTFYNVPNINVPKNNEKILSLPNCSKNCFKIIIKISECSKCFKHFRMLEIFFYLKLLGRKKGIIAGGEKRKKEANGV
jgi:hypothetical protein